MYMYIHVVICISIHVHGSVGWVNKSEVQQQCDLTKIKRNDIKTN